VWIRNSCRYSATPPLRRGNPLWLPLQRGSVPPVVVPALGVRRAFKKPTALAVYTGMACVVPPQQRSAGAGQGGIRQGCLVVRLWSWSLYMPNRRGALEPALPRRQRHCKHRALPEHIAVRSGGATDVPAAVGSTAVPYPDRMCGCGNLSEACVVRCHSRGASDAVGVLSIGSEYVYLHAPYLRHLVVVPLSQ